jgi:hypothetical protein
LSRRALEEAALSVSQCEKILAEAREGENRLREGPESSTRLRRLLGLPELSAATKDAGNAALVTPSAKRKPGVRLPRRDPIGQAAAAGVPV